jgi:hypothetical protein
METKKRTHRWSSLAAYRDLENTKRSVKRKISRIAPTTPRLPRQRAPNGGLPHEDLKSCVGQATRR